MWLLLRNELGRENMIGAILFLGGLTEDNQRPELCRRKEKEP
jgi:hypothetical protein